MNCNTTHYRANSSSVPGDPNTFVSVSTGAIAQAPLTLTAVTNTKFQNGTTSAAAIPTVSGLEGSDSVTNLTETYASPNVGTGITLSVATDTIIDGNSGKNYAVTLVSNNTGVITPPAPATFDGEDTTTQGNWIGVYGSQGYDIIGGPRSIPSYATVTPAGQSSYTWSTTSSDPRALQTPNSSNRIAACWNYATSFTVDVLVSDGRPHAIELYAMDFDQRNRNEQIQVSDAATGKVVDTESLSNFAGGAYLKWTISGNLLFTFTNTGGPNAIINGLFFDPPTATITGVASSLNPSTYGQSVTFTATVSDMSAGVPTGSIEFYDGSTDLGHGSSLSGTGNSATSTFTTSVLPAGSDSVSAVYTPTGSFLTSSGSATQTVNTAALTITANPISKTYGNTLTFAGTEFTASGLFNSDSISTVTLTSAGAPATAT